MGLSHCQNEYRARRISFVGNVFGTNRGEYERRATYVCATRRKLPHRRCTHYIVTELLPRVLYVIPAYFSALSKLHNNSHRDIFPVQVRAPDRRSNFERQLEGQIPSLPTQTRLHARTHVHAHTRARTCVRVPRLDACKCFFLARATTRPNSEISDIVANVSPQDQQKRISTPRGNTRKRGRAMLPAVPRGTVYLPYHPPLGEIRDFARVTGSRVSYR